jgi:hypothetical protein
VLFRIIKTEVKDFNDNFLMERGHKENGVLLFLFGVVC